VSDKNILKRVEELEIKVDLLCERIVKWHNNLIRPLDIEWLKANGYKPPEIKNEKT